MPDLTDAQLATLLASMPKSRLERVMNIVPQGAAKSIKAVLAKRKFTSDDPITGEDARSLLMKLIAVERATGHSWRTFVQGWILSNYEEKGNAYPQALKPKPRWEAGPDMVQSTAMCLVPKAKKQPAKDGYVTFDIPSLWSDVIDKAGRETMPQKIGAHRIVCLASQAPPISVGGEIYEVSHYCGNPFCIRHVAWETKSQNQSRGRCFITSGADAQLNVPCTGHGTNIPCIRVRAAAVTDQVRLAMSGPQQMDTRSDVVAALITDLFSKTPAERQRIEEWWAQLTKVGKGVTALKKFFRLEDASKRLMKAEYKAKFAALKAQAEAPDQTVFESMLQEYVVTPSPPPAEVIAARGR